MDWKSKRVTAILEQALIEDRATADATTALTIDPDLPASATILAKQDCVLAGIGMIPRVLQVFALLDTGKPARRFEVISHPEIFDGVRLHKGQAVAVIRHNARTILACERVLLNLMQRMCGIATTTRQYVDAVKGTGAIILDTRKTVPGLRLLDKYAVTCGGGTNHRMDLADGVLIKNNHISLGGGVANVLVRARSLRKPGQKIQVEVRTMEELTLALDDGADSLLLDNMTPAEVKHAVQVVRKRDKKIPLEASGGMTLETVRKYAKMGVNFISVGALTHSIPAVDLSMRITADIY
ncbi:MAG TPA: carboxylating nicotinate-nucleotide diphosphorylase [Acidobacteriaceae bacterium]|jgi:nicotinate-nucleotide pyrophosphorylase (carboxylating)|nr:carboxylating nicotinate-nucleotide diphosphorylase [Acidobacteriaceae bacterium]